MNSILEISESTSKTHDIAQKAIIKREGKLFHVYNSEGLDSIFNSYDFDECVEWVKNNGGFYEARKKIKERLNRIG